MSRVPIAIQFLTAAVFACAILTWVSSGRVMVCYDLKSGGDAVTKVYWDTGSGFSERHSTGIKVSGGGLHHVCLRHPDMRAVVALRIDPIDQPLPFSVQQTRVLSLDLLPPWRGLLTVPLVPGEAAARQDIESADGRYLATGVDPWLQWAVSARPYWQAAVLNVTTVIIIVALILFGIRAWTATVLSPSGPALRPLGCFVFFVLYLGLCMLSAYFVDLFYYLDVALFANLVLTGVYLAGARSGFISANAPLYLGAGAFLVVLLAFDAAYRMGMPERALFAVNSHDPYHWKFTRRAEHNLDNSSLRYYPDFKRIQKVVVPDAYFIADLATSYYVAAALPLYAKVTHPHHSRRARLYERLLSETCSASTPGTLRERLGQVFHKERELGRELPIYFFVNRDRGNKNVRNRCPNKAHQHQKQIWAGLAVLEFEGQFLDVYRIKVDSVL